MFTVRCTTRGKPKRSLQNEHLLVIVDYCSKWVELFLLRTAKAHQIANILVKDIFTRSGTPAFLVSDCGPQFTSHLLQSVWILDFHQQSYRKKVKRFLNQSPSPDHGVYRVIQRQQELVQQVRENVEKFQAKQAKYYNRRSSPACFQSGDGVEGRVWLRSHPLSQADVGFPAKLVER
ncbi:hypothetical protein MHYP_G00058790 [Metynnis hypsauchen]